MIARLGFVTAAHLWHASVILSFRKWRPARAEVTG